MLTRLNDLLRKYQALSSWVLVLVTFVVYQGILAAGFVYDDVPLILQNPYIKNPHLWRRILLAPMWSFLGYGAQSSFYRPMGIFLLWLVCRVGGLQPSVYHLFQLSLYSVAIWVVYQIGRKLLRNESAAFVGALLWTLHPLHVEAVAWASAIPDIACGLFCLLGFWLFLRAEARSPTTFRDHALAAAVFFLGLFCKELAFSFPLLLLAYWFCFPSKDSWLRRALHWVPYIMAAAVCAVIRVAVMGRFAHGSMFRGLRPRVAWVAIGLLGEHAKDFLWPVQLSEFRDFTISTSLHSIWPWAALVVLAAAVLGKKRNPLLSFLVLWWFVTLAPCLDYRQLTFPLVEDQFSYFPSVGLCLAVGYLFFAWAPQRFAKFHPTPAAAGALTVIAALWTAQTMRAIPRWNNNDTLFNYSLHVSPSSALVHVSHGVDLQFRSGDLDGAAHEFQTALTLNAQNFRHLPPVDYDSYLGLGQIALMRGREQEALDYFNKAVHLLPSFTFGYHVLGSVYFPRGDYARAAGYFEQAVRLNPMDTSAQFYLGTCWMKLGKPLQAAEQFRAAREVVPEYFQAYAAEAGALDAAGDEAGAANVRRLIASH